MTTYEYHVYREGKWWMVEIPAIDGLTQARHLTDVEDIARSYISLDQDVPPSEVQLRRASVKVRGRDVTADAGEVTRLRNSAAELHKQARHAAPAARGPARRRRCTDPRHRHGGQRLVPASRADRPTGRTRREDGEPRGCPSLRDHHAHEDVPVITSTQVKVETRVQHRYPQ